MLIKHIYILFFISVILWQQGFAQRYSSDGTPKNLQRYDVNPYHFGFTLGFNQMDFVVKKVSNYRSIDSLHVLESSPGSGFNIGIVSNLRLGMFWDLRFIPSLYFGQRQLNYTYVKKNKTMTDVKTIESNLLDFPLLFKYKSARMTNTRVYVIGGLAYTLDLASLSKKKSAINEVLVKLNRDDFTYQLGVGFDFYLTYFKFSTELKMEFGTKNLIKKEDNFYNNPIDKLNSKMMILSFTFE